jgi:choline dehydrogenase-like flavoprotein
MIHEVIGAFRKIGFQSHRALCQFPDMGTSLHYAGTLPMSERPGPYQTDANGVLAGSRRVYVADAACFSELPAKNLTFTIMANAMRIAAGLARSLE